MIQDLNKGIVGIDYNHLNLPTAVYVNGQGDITFTYTADGTKLRKVVSENGNTTTTDYASNFIYINNELKQFSHPEGYVSKNGSTFDYVYHYKDHLGSVRLAYSDLNGNGLIEASTEILQERNTYPFGLEHKGYNNNVIEENNFQTYLGQELNKELGLGWLTFRYRNYMPELGRFFCVDPISSEYMSISTYQFAHNNPIWKIELEGLEGQEKQGKDAQHHEPVKVVNKTTNHAGAGTVGTAVVVKETAKATVELSKSYIDDAGRLVLEGSKKPSGWTKFLGATGRVFGTVAAMITPTTMGSGTRYDEQGRDKTDPDYPNVKTYAIDEKFRVDDKKVGKIKGDSDSPIKRFKESDLLHSEDLITGSESYKDISKLTDDELIESVMNPKNGDYVTVNSKTGKIIQGNTRVFEILKRGLEVDIPVRTHNPNDSDYFYDIKD